VDRYLSISDEYSFYYTAEIPTESWRVRIMISSVWLISALVSSVPIFSDFFTTQEYLIELNNLDYVNGKCLTIVNKHYRIVSSCISFWLPAIGMITFYTLVMKKANKMEKNKLQFYQIVNPVHSDLNNSNTQNRNSTVRSSGEVVFKRKYKVNKAIY
jgi:hypothetical protein